MPRTSTLWFVNEPQPLHHVTVVKRFQDRHEGFTARVLKRHVGNGYDELKGFFGRRFAEDEPVIFGRNDYCSATIWMRTPRQSGWPFWRSRRGDDCRGATITQAIFS